MSDANPTSSFKIPHWVIVKAPGLLPMQYTAHEIVEELRIPESTLRDWLLRGAPHSRDEYNHLWVNGRRFAAWVEEQRKSKHRSPRKLKEGEGYCMRCNQIVEMLDPIVRHIKGKLFHTKGQCPTCGCAINRGGRHGRTAELPQS
jgi:hypothetical protein